MDNIFQDALSLLFHAFEVSAALPARPVGVLCDARLNPCTDTIPGTAIPGSGIFSAGAQCGFSSRSLAQRAESTGVIVSLTSVVPHSRAQQPRALFHCRRGRIVFRGKIEKQPSKVDIKLVQKVSPQAKTIHNQRKALQGCVCHTPGAEHSHDGAKQLLFPRGDSGSKFFFWLLMEAGWDSVWGW